MICSRRRTQILIFICLYSFLMNLGKTTCGEQATFVVVFFHPRGKGNNLLLIGVSFRQMQYQETDYLFWAISPQPPTLSYLNFRMVSFWCLKSKSILYLTKPGFLGTERFFLEIWLIVCLWPGGQWTNYPYLYVYLSLYVQVVDYRERYTGSPKINGK